MGKGKKKGMTYDFHVTNLEKKPKNMAELNAKDWRKYNDELGRQIVELGIHGKIVTA